MTGTRNIEELNVRYNIVYISKKISKKNATFALGTKFFISFHSWILRTPYYKMLKINPMRKIILLFTCLLGISSFAQIKVLKNESLVEIGK